MPDLVLVPKPALLFPPFGDAARLRVAPLPEGRVILALAPAGDGEADAALAVFLRDALGDGGPSAIRAVAPGQWFAVSDRPLVPGELSSLAERVGSRAALSDQSHGRVRIGLEGPLARGLLTKGLPLDMADRAFPVGRSAQTLFNHIGVHVARLAPERYELTVLRSFAACLWEELELAAAEHLPPEPARS